MEESTMTPTPATTAQVRVANVIAELTIDAPPERVWQAMVEEAPEWWLPEFYTMKGARFIIEPHVGGRAYEDAGDGNGLVWFNVIGVDPPRSLHLSGFLYPPYTGPAVTLVNITLEANDKGGTNFKLSDSLLGIFDEDELTHGWPYLFDSGLKAYVEKKKEFRR